MKSFLVRTAVSLVCVTYFLSGLARLQGPAPSERISLSSSGTEGDGDSKSPAVSFDGRYIAFESKSANLVAGDTNLKEDVFLHDRETGTTVRVSVSSAGVEADDKVKAPAISGDGRWVAFETKATNLVAGDTNATYDVFLHELATGETMRVSVGENGEEGDKASKDPAMSGDGRYIAFKSDANNLVAGDTGHADVFVHDRVSGELTRVSKPASGSPNGSSGEPAISADGRFVAFKSKASNLVLGDTNGKEDVFVSEWQTGTIVRVSVTTDGSESNKNSKRPALSGNGRFVVFESDAMLAVADNPKKDIFIHDRETGETSLVSFGVEEMEMEMVDGEVVKAERPSISANGRFIVYRANTKLVDPVGKKKSRKDIFVRDRTNGVTRRLNFASDGSAPDKNSTKPVISGDGSVVAFESDATNLVAGDANTDKDIFVVGTGFNPGPTATLDAAVTTRGQLVLVAPLANDTGVAPLTVTSVTSPVNGTSAVVNAGSGVTYLPDSGFVGTDSFSYTVQDGNGDTATAFVNVTVEDAPPVAVDDEAVTEAGTLAVVAVLTNDRGDAIEVTSVSSFVGGVATHDAQNVTYTPQADFVGAGSFDYTITDVDGETSQASVSVTVTAPQPVAVDDSVTTEAGSDAVVAVLSNDSGVGLSVSVGSPPSSGEAVVNGDTVTYSPNAGFSGTDSFGYSVTDVASQNVTATVTIAVTPKAVDDTAATFVGAPVNVPVLANDLGASLSLSSLTQPSSGTATINGGSIDYTPGTTTGVFGFTYTLTDGAGQTAMGNVSVTVENPPPVAVDDTGTTESGSDAVIAVVSNDTGIELSVEVSSPASNGTTAVNVGAITYSPNAGFSGTDSFGYTVTDPSSQTATAMVTVTVTPKAVDDTASVFVGSVVNVPVLANDLGTSLSITSITPPSSGSAAINGTSIDYTPSTTTGVFGFTYTLTDGEGQTSTGNVSVTVAHPPPVAADDTRTTESGNDAVVAVLTNDTGIGLSVSVTSPASNGTTTVNPGNTVTYSPNAGFSGTDSFGYTVTDPSSQTASATVTVTVTPKAVDDTASTFVGIPVNISVLANDLGASLSLTSITQPSSGSAAINGSTIDYTPDTSTGVFGFTYTLTDGAGQTETGNVSVTVDPPPNQNPVALDDTATTFESVFVDIDVLGNDSDPDGDGVTLTSVSVAGSGTTSLVGGVVRYTPNPGFDGAEAFTYVISDGKGGSATGNVSVTVQDDVTPPTSTVILSRPANANGWHNADVTVTFDCQDGESGVASCSDPVVVTTEGADQSFTGDAVDNGGNSASVSVTISLDKTAPSVSLSGPVTGRRGQTFTVSASGSDNLSFENVTVSVDGVDVATLTTSPFEAQITIPTDAIVGSAVTVAATASDLAGNTAAATSLSIDVLGGGFVSGEVYDDAKGLPLAGVSVLVNGQPATSGPLGRFDVFTNNSFVEVVVSQLGYTSVERVVTVDQLAGTVVLDARLTALDVTTTLGAGGGTATNTAGNIRLTMPPGVLSADIDFEVTEVSGLGLRSALPLGWSPIGAVELGPSGTSILGATLELDGEDFTGLSLVLVRYDESSNAWVVEAEGLTGDTLVTATIDETGAYAFVVADTGATLPPPVVVGDPLLGVAPIEVFFGLSASSEVTPETSPIGEDAHAEGSVVLFSPLVLPSGTVVSATVEESFESFTEGTLISEPFTQEIPLYRFPLRSDDELHQEFPVTPSRTLTLEETREGRIHVSIGTAPAFVKGALVGGEGFTVTGDGGAELVVPAGALTETVSAAVTGLDPLELGVRFEGLTLVAAAEVDLSSGSLLSAGTLSVLVALATTDNLFAARYLFVAGQRKLRLLGPASYADGRISTAIDTGGTYLFFQSSEPLALIQGTVTEGGTPANLVVVESSTSPFMDITPSTGFYVVAAKLEATTLTARSLVSGNQAAESVTPGTTDPVTLDIVLTTTGPFVSAATPPDGATGVPLAPVITITFSEPVDASTVDLSSLSLTKADTTPVPGRVIVGAGNLTASYLPDDNLEAITGYVLSATAGILDTTGNPLLPFTSSFTTLDDAIPELNPDALAVSFPDSDGFVTIQAPVFSFEANAAVTILNVTNANVVTGNVASDGSMFFQIRAAITDELQIRIIDASDRELVFDKTEYQGPSGEVAIGRKGGKIANGDFLLEVPEGALSGASVFTLTPVDQAVIDGLALADGAGGFGAAVEVDMGGARLSEEAELSFAVPPAAPADAEYAVVRKLEEAVTVYEVIDTASVDEGKVKTDSFPFLGVRGPGFYMVVWYPPLPGPSPNPMGAITGLARATDGAAATPEEAPLANVRVSADRDPLLPGDYVARTGADGRFVLFDAFFGGSPVVNLKATDELGREARAVAFQDPNVSSRFLALARFNGLGEVVFNFELLPPPPSPGVIRVSLFRDDTEITNGFAVLGEELTIRLLFTVPASSVNLTVNDEPAVVRATSEVEFEATYTPTEARSYTLEATAIDAFVNQLIQRKSFLAVQAGAGNDVALEGPPAIITDSAVPRPGDEGIPVSQVFSVQFTEPVTNVSATTVTLTDVAGAVALSLNIIGTKVDGSAGPVAPQDVVVALTMTPAQGLKFSTAYELAFSTAIVDTDVNAQSGAPEPKSLNAETNVIDFKTFTPTVLGQAPLDATLVALTTIGNRAFVASQPSSASGASGVLEVFDLSDPTQPRKEEGVQDSIFPGSMVRDIASEEGVDLGLGPRDVVAVLSLVPAVGNAGLTIFDVTGFNQPFPYVGFVTTTIPGASFVVDLHEGFAYVASGTVGVSVVNLSTARELFQAETGESASTSIPFNVSRGLFTRGLGFGRSAIVNTVSVAGQSIQAVTVENVSQGTIGFVGSISTSDFVGHFTTVNFNDEVASTTLNTIPLDNAPGVAMGQPTAIELTQIADTDYAVVAGGPTGGQKRGTLAILDVSAPAFPVLVSLIELEGGWAQDLAIDEDGVTVFVSTAQRQDGNDVIPAQVEIYNLTDPAEPQLAGTIQGVSGDLASAQGALVSADTEELSTTALTDVVLIRLITPTTVSLDPGPPLTENPVMIQFGVEPSDISVVSAEVEIFQDNTLVDTLTAEISGSEGTAVWPAGRPVDLKASYFARAVVHVNSENELRSARSQMPVVHIVLIDKRGEEAFAPPLSDPRPVVTLDPASPQDVTLLGDGRTALVRFSGEVTDALADITPNGAADIREVFVGDQSFPVRRVGDAATLFRPFAFRGRFDGTATVNIRDGENPIIVEASNVAGNVGYDGLTVTVSQDANLPEPVATGNVVLPKFLDPFTLVLAPLSANAPDTVLLVHAASEPTGTSSLIETADESLTFVGTNAQLGVANLTLSEPFAANSTVVRDSVEAVVASSFLAITAQTLEFVETDFDSGVFRNAALRLSNNELLQVRLESLLDDGELDVIHVRLGFDTEDDGTRIEETGVNSATFVESVPGLGNVTVVVRALNEVAGRPTSLAIFLASDELDLDSYLMDLFETASGSLRFLSQVAGPALEFVFPTEPHSTQLESVVDDEGSDAGMFEPFWAVARGLTALEPTDRGFVDQTQIELSLAPLPFRQGSGGIPTATLREVRSRLPLAFVSGRLETPQVSVFEASQDSVVPGDVSQPLAHDILIEGRFVSVRRSTGAILLNKFAGIRGARMRLVNSYLAVPSVPDWVLDQISVAGGGVTIAKESQTIVPVARGNVREIRTTFTVDVDKEAALGRRDIKVYNVERRHENVSRCILGHPWTRRHLCNRRFELESISSIKEASGPKSAPGHRNSVPRDL